MKPKICFVIPSLRAGGAERVMAFLAENIDRDKFSSELLVIGTEQNKSYDVNGVTVHFLNKARLRSAIYILFNYFKKNKKDIVISSLGHVNLAMASMSPFFRKTKFVGRETYVKTRKGSPKPSSFSLLLAKIQSKLLDAIICQSQDMYQDLLLNFKFDAKKLVVLNNPITKKTTLKEGFLSGPIKKFITIGRLVDQKGYPRILRALARYNEPFHYTIIGTGINEGKIYSIIRKNGLEDKITHIPFTKDVQKYLAENDLYLQGSYVEGFPNALLESCSVGTPVLAFDAPGGINEIVQEGINGYIAKDEDDFLEKLKKATTQKWNVEKIGESVYSRYSKKIIVEKYEDFLNKLFNNTPFHDN